MSENNFYITSPLYYVNDKPHIGTAYTTILCDVIARYQRMFGKDVFYLTGVDEHGQKVQQAAEKKNISPKQHVDQMVTQFKDTWDKLDIQYDDFVRTTEERHSKVVQQVLQNLFDKGEIYKASYGGWYCVSEEVYYTEKELVDGKSPFGKEVEYIEEANYFFKMSKYQDWLIQYIEENPDFIQPAFRANETLGFLKNELQDLCISRPKSRLSWGIELPFDHDFVTYVWFDALINYISVPGYLSDEAAFEKWWPANYQFIGKDILTTHTVYWTTMLKAMGLEMPKTVFAHGWWLTGEGDEKKKVGKSEGNAISPLEYADEYGVDSLRYVLMAAMSLGQDAAFTHEIFLQRYNSELANDLGNLASRVLKLVKSGLEGKHPEIKQTDLPEAEQALWSIVQEAVVEVETQVNSMRPDLGIAAVISAVRETNKYLELRKPWLQVKEEDKGPLAVTLYTASEVLRVVSALLAPVMPAKMGELRKCLGCGDVEPCMTKAKEWGVLAPGTEVDPAVLFPRIQEKKKSKKPAKEEKAMEEEKTENLITFDQFGKVELKTAQIYHAEKIEDTEKLLRLEVFVGEEKRQIVAGIALYYEPEELIGRTVVIVANLKPAKLRGVESQGMLLAAKAGHTLRLVSVDGDISSGASVS